MEWYVNIHVEDTFFLSMVRSNVRSGKHIGIGISPLIFRKVEPSKESAILDHLLVCNNIASFEEFIILAYGYHKYILEIKESMLIKLDRSVLSKNISSAKLKMLFRTYNFRMYKITRSLNMVEK